MKVVIIEDEIPAAEKLKRYLSRYDPQIEVMDTLQSVSDSIEWLRRFEKEVDLIFMDIELVDGQSFGIFEELAIQKPIIFTTAYDEYALKAFDVNSIAYLLKPINFDELTKAINKFNQIAMGSSTNLDLSELLRNINTAKKYKSRFMIKIGDHIRAITIDQILFFYAEGRNAYIQNDQGRRLIIDYTLEELEEILDPVVFFRVNRSYIVNLNAIEEVLVYSNSRLKVITRIKSEKEIIVSREKVGHFKMWFDGQNPTL